MALQPGATLGPYEVLALRRWGDGRGPCAILAAFAAGSRGIYYAGCEPRSDPPVYVLNPATGKQRLLGQLEKPTQSMPVVTLGVSPDGTRVLYTRDASNGADLMLIENFR